MLQENTLTASRAVETAPRTAVRRWELLGLAVIMLLAAGLRLWRLDQNGYGTEYYTSAVRSMMDSWHNFFYASFDPAGFISIDKPPVALWVQVASVKLFGFGKLSVLVPQALEGIAAVLILYHLVRRRFGVWAAFCSGLFLAITPVSVAADRSSNTDSCLVLVLLLAAWALIRAAETGKFRYLLLCVILGGVGFNTKMLAAFMVMPAFYLVYFLGAPIGWIRRLAHLAVAAVVLFAVSLSWAAAYDLTSPEQRPFAGSTKGNSMFELIVEHNGLERFIRRGRFGGRPATPPGGQAGQGSPAAPAQGGDPAAGGAPVAPGFGPGFGRGGAGGPGGPPGAGTRFPGGPGGARRGPFGNAPAGILRLADRHMAGQVLWLLPLAILGMVAAVVRARWSWTIDPAHQMLLLWFVWLMTCAVSFSYAGGIFHAYYLVMLAPPMAALAGIGLVALWATYQRGGWRTLLLPLAVLLTAAWQAYIWFGYADLSRWFTPSVVLTAGAAAIGLLILRGSWLSLLIPGTLLGAAGWQYRVLDQESDLAKWLTPTLLGGTAAGAVGLVALWALARRWPSLQRWAPAALALGCLALLLSQGAWAITPLVGRGNVMLPAADVAVFTRTQRPGFPGVRGPTDNRKLLAFLRANHQGERFLMGVSSTQQAAPIIIETGEAVMAMGGFMGSDPTLTPEQFADMVERKEIRFVMVSGFGRGGMPGGGRGNGDVMKWIRDHGKPVPRDQWAPPAPERRRDGNPGPMAFGPDGGNGLAPQADGNGPPPPTGGNRPARGGFGTGRGRGGFRGMVTNLYDCRPEAGLVAPPTE